MKHRKAVQITVMILFILYAAAMLFLLFVRRLINCGFDITVFAVPDYLTALAERFEPYPFRTVTEFIGRLEIFSLSDLAFRNLFGNVLLFIPAGIFLPLLFRKQRRFPVFLMTFLLTICVIELTQMFTLLGSCDIDDVMLNTAGACAGFGIYRLISRVMRL